MTSRDRLDEAAARRFERDLGQFLLVAFAAGDDVEGGWCLMDTDPMVPDVDVVVTRVDPGPAAAASGEGATFSPSGPGDFKTRLQSFVLERFADGDDVEGTWEVRYVRESLPTWEVYISTSADSEEVRTGDELSHRE